MPHGGAVSKSLDQYKMALLVGTEGDALSADAESAADHRVRIQIDAGIDSLNLAVAVGIALYRLTLRM